MKRMARKQIYLQSHQDQQLKRMVKETGLSEAELLRRLEPGRRALLEARGRRERPLTDDKVLTDWNGLMIGAMARAGARLAEPRYLAAAERAAGFVLSRLVETPGGPLLHSYRDGRAHVPAFLDDYAFLVEGLLELHATTGEKRWLDEAVRLAGEQERRLGDAAGGGWFAAGEDPRLLVRAKPAFDGAVASGNGIAALNGVELSRRTGDPAWASRAEAAILAFAEGLEQAPLAHVTLARALERLLAAPRPQPSATRAAEAEPAVAPASAAEALEEEAYEAAEIEGRLGSSDDEDWKPFRVEIDVRKGWHVNANLAGPGLVATAVAADRRLTNLLSGIEHLTYSARSDRLVASAFHGAGYDLRRGGRAAIDQHHEGHVGGDAARPCRQR